MSHAYDLTLEPPAPSLGIRLAAAGEPPFGNVITALIDTGADGTLIPTALLEQVEAIAVGDALLRSVLGEVRAVHLFEIDLHLDALIVPGVLVAGDDYGAEVLLGRNVLNKLILILDGPAHHTDVFEVRPSWR